jgi:glycosyltransferase involved in cell wall biosynthesis
MKILFNAFTACRLRTGVGSYAKSLLAELKNQSGGQVRAFPDGWLAAAVSTASSLLAARPRDANSQPSRELPLRRKFTGFVRHAARKVSQRTFRRASLRHDFDLYHEPNFIPWPCDIPAVVSVHDLSTILYPEWHPAERMALHRRQFERGLAHCRHIITGSKCVRAEIIRHLGFPGDRVSAIPNGIRTDLRPMSANEVAPLLAQLKLSGSYLLYLGTIEPRKNLLTLLRAYCGLSDSLRSRCPLVLAGTWGWNFAAIRDFYESTARHRGAIHLGYVADAHLPALYNGARALVYPSYYEGFGLPPIEMMACGGPVIASTAAALREVCGNHAQFVEPDDEAGWNDAMRKVIEHDDWREELRRGVIEFSRRYSWQRCAKLTWQTYQRALSPEIASSAQETLIDRVNHAA